MPQRRAAYTQSFDGKDEHGRGLITSFRDEYFFLSNFWEEPFEVKGLIVASAEHAYQAQKTLDKTARNNILAARSPGTAKRLGRAAPMRPGWEEGLRVKVMREVIRWKFPSATGERDLTTLAINLMNTGDQHLVEGNTWGDRFWGCEQEPPGRGVWCGANMHGILLMERREQLQSEIPF